MELDQVEWWKEEELGGEQKKNISRVKKSLGEREKEREREKDI